MYPEHITPVRQTQPAQHSGLGQIYCTPSRTARPGPTARGGPAHTEQRIVQLQTPQHFIQDSSTQTPNHTALVGSM